jgi:ATP-dependent RNA circularization protein (DNA/RNA ligase family)
MAALSEAAPTHSMVSAETIQDIVNALSIIPTYVRELERQNSFLQKSSEMKAIRLLQLEKEYVQIIRGNLVISNCLAHGFMSGCWTLGAVRGPPSDPLSRN